MSDLLFIRCPGNRSDSIKSHCFSIIGKNELPTKKLRNKPVLTFTKYSICAIEYYNLRKIKDSVLFFNSETPMIYGRRNGEYSLSNFYVTKHFASIDCGPAA